MLSILSEYHEMATENWGFAVYLGAVYQGFAAATVNTYLLNIVIVVKEMFWQGDVVTFYEVVEYVSGLGKEPECGEELFH